MRRTYHKAKKEPTKQFRANHQINYPQIFLIDENGDNLGVLPTPRALTLAEEAGLDLIEVNPKAEPPICKIMDYGQFKYERDKKLQKQKSKNQKTDTKCVRLSVRIGEHDLNLRLNQAKKFLLRGDKLRIELRLKGRERQHPQAATDMINRFIKTLSQAEDLNVVVEDGLTKQGGSFNILLTNKKANLQ